MVTRGEYKSSAGYYGIVVNNTKDRSEVLLISAGTVWSAYLTTLDGEYSWNNNHAKDAWKVINGALKACTAKNQTAVPFVKGTASRHTFKKAKTDYMVDKFAGELVGLFVGGDDTNIQLEYYEGPNLIPAAIPYIKLASRKEISASDLSSVTKEESVVIRSIEEIALEKDLSWVKNKKYYIVNDDAVAEQIFSYLDNYNGPISYDTETSGLKINMFGKINSKWAEQLKEYNSNIEDPENHIRTDYLVGIIFSVEADTAYYFPVKNRKFANLYEDKNSGVRKSTIDFIRKQKIVDDPNCQTDMGRLLYNSTDEELTSDVILMERVRRILETKHIVAHNGVFEWKVDYLYDIVTNLKDDTILLHQVMYKFRSTTSNRGEPSNLKYLEKREFGIDSVELEDFFPDFSEDDSGKVRSATSGSKKRKSKKSRIDFSYMDYDGTRVYAPADGDWTLQLYFKYKRDLIENHREMEYIYSVEVMVACAVAYMEFHGHRIDENKIEETKNSYIAKKKELEEQIRKEANLGADVDVAKVLSSPAQVAKLFFETMGMPFSGDKPSVKKSSVKPLLSAKNPDKTNKYPVVHLYSAWKKADTMLTKFFDNLPDFMYPGGYIFSSYGQIAAATGRMSCRAPNAQQYPKDITGIVVPRPGCVMMDCDYSQIEYRVLVALAKEPKLAALFSDPDTDYHTLMASLMYGVPYASVTPGMRGDAKSFNFGIPYGMGFKSLAILLTGQSGPAEVEEAKVKYELYFKDQPKVRAFFDMIKESAAVNKYTKTYWNRYRHYSFVDKDGKISNARKAMALRQAGNAIIQGTAADIFKIAVAKMYMYIKQNKLFGLLYMINLVHDEILYEVNVEALNPQRILKDVADNMQFKVAGFPPLFIGAGVGKTWKSAKGKEAEIHPLLCNIISENNANTPIFRSEKGSVEETYQWFEDAVFKFREDKVRQYILDPSNYGQDLHPVIGNLINLQFHFDLAKTGLAENELTKAALAKFIEVYGLNVPVSNFYTSTAATAEVEEEDDYEDEEDDEEYEGDFSDSDFALIDEDDSLYGVSLHELIDMFGLVVSKEKRVCGIHIKKIPFHKQDELADYIQEHLAEDGADDPDAVQVMFLKENNILLETGLWIKNVDGSAMSTRLKIAALG